eukprot:TRINITY_DN5510_c2_g1_i1.p1 TRINITY_DN5510_c2_g1~~TRINITY_DN5510_c2_g1_i1.p1  ORF type:complete len:116 (+),score=1.17 TRINITY_DN5510_c2_g1_i1:479-826(+)
MIYFNSKEEKMPSRTVPAYSISQVHTPPPFCVLTVAFSHDDTISMAHKPSLTTGWFPGPSFLQHPFFIYYFFYLCFSFSNITATSGPYFFFICFFFFFIFFFFFKPPKKKKLLKK